MSQPFRVLQIDHVELWVPDQREAAEWYARVFGLEPVEEFEHWADGGPLMLATAEARTMLALFAGSPETRTPRRTADFRRVAFRVDGEGFVRFLERVPRLKLETEGGDTLDPDDFVDHDGSLSIYFRDPWGHAFEVTTYEVLEVRTLLAAS